jgi:K+-transporting ATPase c subunit
MTTLLCPAVVLVAGFTLLLGLALPLGVTGLAGALFPGEAGGSLIRQEGRVIGSALIAQRFEGPGRRAAGPPLPRRKNRVTSNAPGSFGDRLETASQPPPLRA